jgi:hypothetical protein
MKLGIFAALVIAIAARTAAAEPRVVFSPPSYTTLPPDPVVYLFEPGTIESPLAVDMTYDDSDAGELVRAWPVARHVYRVPLSTGRHDLVHLRYGGEDITYRIGGAAPSHHVEAVLGYAGRALEIGVRGDAVAYRVEWEARSWDELVGGTVRRAYLPIERGDDYDRVTIRGGDVPAHAFDLPRMTRLVALFADGGEQAVSIGAQRLDDDPGPRDRPISVAPGSVTPAPPPAPDEPAWWPFALFPLVTVVACGVLARRAAIAAVATLLVTIALARPAAAECAEPRTRISPPTGASLAVDPVLYVFAPLDDPTAAIAAWQGGARLRVDVDRVDQRPAWSVYRVTIHDSHAGELIVAYPDGTATYALAAHAPADHAALFATELVEDHWMCSRTVGVSFATRGNAVAYRLDWLDADRPGLIASAYLPITTDVLGGANTFVGMLSCIGYDVPTDAFLAPTPVELVALFADGREAAVPLGMIRIDEDRGVLRAPEDYAFGAAMDPAPPAPPPRARWAVDAFPMTAPEPLWPALLIAGASGTVGGGALMGLALRVRRRRRVPARVGQLAD